MKDTYKAEIDCLLDEFDESLLLYILTFIKKLAERGMK